MFHKSVNCTDSILFWYQNSEFSLKLWRLYCSHSIFQSKYHEHGHNRFCVGRQDICTAIARAKYPKLGENPKRMELDIFEYIIGSSGHISQSSSTSHLVLFQDMPVSPHPRHKIFIPLRSHRLCIYYCTYVS